MYPSGRKMGINIVVGAIVLGILLLLKALGIMK